MEKKYRLSYLKLAQSDLLEIVDYISNERGREKSTSGACLGRMRCLPIMMRSGSSSISSIKVWSSLVSGLFHFCRIRRA